LLLLRS